MAEDVCHPVAVTVDGQEEAILVHGGRPPVPDEQAILGKLVAAARRLMADDRYSGVRQSLALAKTHACVALPEGEAKGRLRAAVRGAMDALREAAEVRNALAELVKLKDGPRDGEWERAWERARTVLGREEP